MADILIRDVPDSVLRAIDADAKRQGLSRSEYLRRSLERTARSSEASVTVGDLELFAEAFSDLQDPDVMKRAWE
ncbi:type II toxin-antitoxin system VapB family antitoxin [Nocardiopsis alba]|uniref:Ribbon-helix-helix protein, CopG family n=1 Tax=Nocardiopsis alba TaxID=53437 RepID=A0ABV5E196_9ACTN|nr:ribbon-helix-helix protein, CopG family [Nocardiopsis alba]